MSEGVRPPQRWSRMPLSAPLWVWLIYASAVGGLGCMAGTFNGFAAVIFASGFSFQFWTFACWRGARRAAR